jgi:hypothetical protein
MEPGGSVHGSLDATNRLQFVHGKLDVVASAADLEPQLLRCVHAGAPTRDANPRTTPYTRSGNKRTTRVIATYATNEPHIHSTQPDHCSAGAGSTGQSYLI